MKGIVFKELISMMENAIGEDGTDQILQSLDLPSNAAYTSAGTYSHDEILSIVGALSSHMGVDGGALVKAFGKQLFEAFKAGHAQYFKTDSAHDFLFSVDQYIHIEVRKLYPDAELPEILVSRSPEGNTIVTYRSKRPFADLAEGLIESTYEHFDEKISIECDDLSNPCERVFSIKQSA